MRYFCVFSVGLVLATNSFGANIYSGMINGTFSNVQTNGVYVNQTLGPGAPPADPTRTLVARNNAGTAVVTGNNTSRMTWGSCAGCNLPAGVPAFSSVQWVPQAFNNQAPNVDFVLGTLLYTNGTIALSTGAYGADLTLTGAVTSGGAGVAVDPFVDTFNNFDTVNINSNNAAYNTFWNADFLFFGTIPFVTWTAEGGTAAFTVHGKIVGDPMITIDFFSLDPNFVDPQPGDIRAQGGVTTLAGEDLAPEPATLLLSGGALVAMAGLTRRRRRFGARS